MRDLELLPDGFHCASQAAVYHHVSKLILYSVIYHILACM